MSISTHVLDTMRGTPAAGLAVRLDRREPDGDWKPVGDAETESIGGLLEQAPNVDPKPTLPASQSS